MKRNRSIIAEPGLFFVTTTLKGWRPLFKNPLILNDVERLLFEVTVRKADALMSYVIMPSHIHLLSGCSRGGKQLSEFLRSLKSLSARRLFPELGSIWMSRFDDFLIRTESQFNTKLNYIHENPGHNRLVDNAIDWKWSSARFWMEDKSHVVLRKDWNWLSEQKPNNNCPSGVLT